MMMFITLRRERACVGELEARYIIIIAIPAAVSARADDGDYADEARPPMMPLRPLERRIEGSPATLDASRSLSHRSIQAA